MGLIDGGNLSSKTKSRKLNKLHAYCKQDSTVRAFTLFTIDEYDLWPFVLQSMSIVSSVHLKLEPFYILVCL